jgi:diguanylate cyclase (GGDEF)-like protein
LFNITTGLTIWCSEAVTLAAVLFFAWRHDRQSPAYLIWAIGFVASAVGFGFVGARGFVPDLLSIEVGNALTLLGESAWIVGFCRLDKRRADWTALLPPLIWLIGVRLPWVHESFANRVVLYDLASAAGATLIAAAVRPANTRREAARMPLAFTFMALACLCFCVALAMVLLKPSAEAALTYRAVSALGSALLITTAIALTGHVLMERSERRWRALSLTDSLTSALNRRGLQEYFSLLLRETAEPSTRIAALLFDLDHFKKINDRYGHQTGDLVLCEFVRTARGFLPRNAGFGRMGGEEFMAFVAVADQTEAEALAETIRSAFCRMPFNVKSTPVTATVSIGVALSTAGDANWDRLTAAADRALYAAKGAGRNCTIVFGEAETAQANDTSPTATSGELVPTVDDQVEALQRIGVLGR